MSVAVQPWTCLEDIITAVDALGDSPTSIMLNPVSYASWRLFFLRQRKRWMRRDRMTRKKRRGWA